MPATPRLLCKHSFTSSLLHTSKSDYSKLVIAIKLSYIKPNNYCIPLLTYFVCKN